MARENWWRPARIARTLRAMTINDVRVKVQRLADLIRGERAPTQEQIAAQAFNVFAREGWWPGHDLEYWLRGQIEVQARIAYEQQSEQRALVQEIGTDLDGIANQS
jgi:hypothetical protein